MKPIFILAIAAIAATGIGAAQLNNNINVTAGGFGTGGTDIASPVDNADVTFNITAVVDEENDNIKNLVTGCFIHMDESLDKDSIVFCKLSNDEPALEGAGTDYPNIIAEGHLDLEEGYESSDVIEVPIHVTAFNGSNSVFLIHDVHVVVIGKNVTEAQPVLIP
ncbi:MAG: hypothetical protein OEM21_10125 [Nitrosopumilus sp.]|nr:hypothetical protein [Nitrosopumilus sp.]